MIIAVWWAKNCCNVVTLDVKCIFIRISNLCSCKPYSWHVHFHSFAPLPTMHNEKKGSILLCISQPTNVCITIQKSRLQYTWFYWPCATNWRDVCAYFTLSNVKFWKFCHHLLHIELHCSWLSKTCTIKRNTQT